MSGSFVRIHDPSNNILSGFSRHGQKEIFHFQKAVTKVRAHVAKTKAGKVVQVKEHERKILGKTSTGKEVYHDSHHNVKEHKDWSGKEHAQAAIHHKVAGSDDGAQYHQDMAKEVFSAKYNRLRGEHKKLKEAGKAKSAKAKWEEAQGVHQEYHTHKKKFEEVSPKGKEPVQGKGKQKPSSEKNPEVEKVVKAVQAEAERDLSSFIDNGDPAIEGWGVDIDALSNKLDEGDESAAVEMVRSAARATLLKMSPKEAEGLHGRLSDKAKEMAGATEIDWEKYAGKKSEKKEEENILSEFDKGSKISVGTGRSKQTLVSTGEKVGDSIRFKNPKTGEKWLFNKKVLQKKMDQIMKEAMTKESEKE